MTFKEVNIVFVTKEGVVVVMLFGRGIEKRDKYRGYDYSPFFFKKRKGKPCSMLKLVRKFEHSESNDS